jgi:hypothetical protein
MIKTFEQFVSDKYGKPINEAYQSSKLREIIKQHGKPKYGSDYKILHDIKDKYIIDIIASPFLSDEQKKEYESKNSGKKIREINLEDETTIVLALTNEEDNLLYPQHIKSPYGGGAYFIDPRNSYAKERHKGNLGKNGGDDIHKKHLENVGKIRFKRFIEGFKKYKNDIVSVIEDIIDCYYSGDEGDYEISDHGDEIDTTIKLGDIEYGLTLFFNNNSDVEVQDNGRETIETEYIVTSLKSFYISVDNDGDSDYEPLIDNVDLDITEKTYKDLFKEHAFRL